MLMYLYHFKHFLNFSFLSILTRSHYVALAGWNPPFRSDWPETPREPPAPAFQVLGLKEEATTVSSVIIMEEHPLGLWRYLEKRNLSKDRSMREGI